MATIKDVAREANVAISTVSNVLNGVDVVSAETKEEVLRAIKMLNYTPNLNGRFLKKTKTNFLGFFVTNVEGPFYSELINGMYSECCRCDYGLTIYLNSEKNVQESFEAILGKRVDGAVILNVMINENHIESFRKFEMPVIFLDREIQDRQISSVVMDNYNGMMQAVKYLVKMGHKQIGYIHGYMDNYDEHMRYKGYVDTLKEYGIEVEKKFEIQGYFSEQGANSAIRAFLAGGNQLPQAYVAANDQMAIGCIAGLKEEGLRVPEDISVVGFDNIEKTAYYSPSVSTVEVSARELGRAAIEKLVQIIEENKAGEIVKVPAKLLVRESCDLRI